MNSPTMTPIIVIVTPTFIPAKTNGIAYGNRARRNICHSLAVSERHSCGISGLALTSPVAVETTTGKNAMKMATTMQDLLPTPSQISTAAVNEGLKHLVHVPAHLE